MRLTAKSNNATAMQVPARGSTPKVNVWSHKYATAKHLGQNIHLAKVRRSTVWYGLLGYGKVCESCVQHPTSLPECGIPAWFLNPCGECEGIDLWATKDCTPVQGKQRLADVLQGYSHMVWHLKQGIPYPKSHFPKPRHRVSHVLLVVTKAKLELSESICRVAMLAELSTLIVSGCRESSVCSYFIVCNRTLQGRRRLPDTSSDRVSLFAVMLVLSAG